jgi:hypothetical protein
METSEDIPDDRVPLSTGEILMRIRVDREQYHVSNFCSGAMRKLIRVVGDAIGDRGCSMSEAS